MATKYGRNSVASGYDRDGQGAFDFCVSKVRRLIDRRARAHAKGGTVNAHHVALAFDDLPELISKARLQQ